MEALGTCLAGTIAAPVANLLLDVSAALSRLRWLVSSLLLGLRSGMLLALDPPAPALRAPLVSVVREPEEQPFVSGKAA